MAELPASDSEDDSTGSLPALSEISTLTGSEYSTNTRNPPQPPRQNLLFNPYTNEMPEDHDGKSRLCMFWFHGCTNRFFTCKDWFKCSKNHMKNIRRPPLQPPRKFVCNACGNFRPGDASIWDAWRSALQHMWDEHVEAGELETLFGDVKTDQTFVRWLHSNRVICDADYKTLLQNPFSTDMHPITETERRGNRRGGR